MEKTCKTCANNAEYPPAHTCDVCTSLDAEEEYEMWTPEKTCLTCKYGEEEDSLKGEFYVKLVCKMFDKEVEVSEVKLADLVGKMTTDMVDSFCKTIKMK